MQQPCSQEGKRGFLRFNSLSWVASSKTVAERPTHHASTMLSMTPIAMSGPLQNNYPCQPFVTKLFLSHLSNIS